MNNNSYFSIDIPEPYSSDGYKCEYEVSNDAIRYYQKFYRLYNENKYTIIKSDNRRRKGQRKQMTKPGDCLIKICKNEENAIDIVGDVLTSIGHIKKQIKNCDCKKLKLFEKIYHSYGNLIPCAEGINIRWGKPIDNFYYKLVKVKETFDNKSKFQEEINIVANKIKDQKTLGNGISNLGCLRYWIINDYVNEDMDWKKFVDLNFLQDYVDNDYNILDVPKDFDIYFDFVIDRIIMRQYRIENNEKLAKEILEKVKHEIEDQL